jgi:hypothetical protein
MTNIAADTIDQIKMVRVLFTAIVPPKMVSAQQPKRLVDAAQWWRRYCCSRSARER